MPKYVIERNIPGAGALTAEQLKGISQTSCGVLKNLGPSIQFLLGVFVYHEPFSTGRGIGFALIWLALAVYSAESWRGLRRSRAAAATEA